MVLRYFLCNSEIEITNYHANQLLLLSVLFMVTKQLPVAIDLQIQCKSMATSKCLVTFFKISTLVFNKKVLEQLEGE